MSIAHEFPYDAGLAPASGPPVPPAASGPRPLHRIAETRRRQGISARSAARRLRITMDQVRRQEDPAYDMPLSELYRWQRALEVPVAELLIDSDAPLSEPVLTRARLLRVMKTVRALKESAGSVPIQRFATMLELQLIEMMPELQDVDAWHSVGRWADQSATHRR
jgi:hypothetical protein